MSVKVSIIIPVYNVEKYIERCIRSVMRQTYTDIECIIVDDGSTDRSIAIVRNVLCDYKGKISFSIINNKYLQGPSGSRNTGTEQSNGKYIFYLDSDDEITNDCIEKLIGIVIKYQDIEIIQGKTQATTNSDYYSLSSHDKLEYINDSTWIHREYFKTDCSLPVDVWNKLIRKNFLEKNLITFKEGIIHEDQLWSFYVAKNLNKIYFVDYTTYIHYTVPNSIMTSLSEKRSNDSWKIILETIIPQISDPCADLQIRKYLFEYLKRDSYFTEHYPESQFLQLFIKKSEEFDLKSTTTALKHFDRLQKRGLGNSVKQWLNTYCLHGNTQGLWKEIMYDYRAFYSNLIKGFVK